MKIPGKQPALVQAALTVTIVNDEIVLDTNAGPSLTSAAARATGQRLIDAADKLDAA